MVSNNILVKIKEGLLDVLFPKLCLGCSKEGQYICKDCEIFLSELPPVPSAFSSQSWGSTGMQIMSVWEYEGIVEKAIHKIKYNGYFDIINELVNKSFEKIDLYLPENTYISYVPMFEKKERYRGFNFAKLIAEKVSKKIDKPVVCLLKKVKNNRSQVGLDPKERLENVRGVFTVKNGASLVGISSVLLVDDVYTTGATMKECAKVLKKAGVKDIYGFTIARKLSL